MPTQPDPLAILGLAYIEFYVGNARQAAHFYRATLGLQPVAFAGLETGLRDRTSYLLQRGNVRFLLTAPLLPDHPIAARIARCGDGVKDVALCVADATAAYEAALQRGAVGLHAPHVDTNEQGRFVRATIGAYGDTVHSLVEYRDDSGFFLPNFRPLEATSSTPDTGITSVDHVVANVELGAMERWVAFYHKVLGFEQLVHFDDEAIATEYSALMSIVVQDGTGTIKLPINEPAEGRKKSQIAEFLEYYGGPGVQHIALATDDICATVDAMRAAGIAFINVPPSYYDDLEARVGTIAESREALQARSILVDRDVDGYLLQIFSQPLQDRPTLFIEIIQRHGSRGFGKGNFKALFEAIEREQAKRGNL
ncbi:4-hydroxyphenylpyruvate dioxygenase [Candidatus Viridilinea mediisalina]|uniref:4-hydroxyphenylpyruvate dioxygenase n=1 Tax=Candidatus Viridilinea mediisalina TaxID=2024553 RepID=A0A2A6RHU5_9CHLR|nr:4-hydroxyphenylpyruvate dioxygenase [Candidatus Viridilinea mediisalina]PDW02592.1 4-hydroxyphenylpyruvate dioxygenase [Candidatus Viridilinea mediisalina]